MTDKTGKTPVPPTNPHTSHQRGLAPAEGSVMDITNTQNQLLKVTGELAEHEQKLRDLVEAIEKSLIRDHIFESKAYHAAKKLLGN